MTSGMDPTLLSRQLLLRVVTQLVGNWWLARNISSCSLCCVCHHCLTSNLCSNLEQWANPTDSKHCKIHPAAIRKCLQRSHEDCDSSVAKTTIMASSSFFFFKTMFVPQIRVQSIYGLAAKQKSTMTEAFLQLALCAWPQTTH